jgi:hypothetical protein
MLLVTALFGFQVSIIVERGRVDRRQRDPHLQQQQHRRKRKSRRKKVVPETANSAKESVPSHRRQNQAKIV